MTSRKSPDTTDGPPKKKMRQGTHSCIECRRRKIKCIFQPEKNGACNECYARGVTCVDQESAVEAQTLETRQSLRERVANLESLIKVIATKVDLEELTTNVPGHPPKIDEDAKPIAVTTTSTKRVVVVPNRANSDLTPSEAGYDRAPIMSILNNSVMTYAHVPPSEPALGPAAAQESKTAEDRIRQKILTHLPLDDDIDAIWAKCSHWWQIWAKMFPELKFAMNAGPDYIKRNTKSGSILSLSKAILALCLGLQQVDAAFIKTRLNLPIPRDDLIQHYVSTIHAEIFSDDRYVLKTEGLEIGILLAKIDANAGRPRKAWLTFRRAISFAILLGFNRMKTWQDTAVDGPRRKAIFWALYSGDRYFSLVLGLPYSLSDQQCDILAAHEPSAEGPLSSQAMYGLCALGGRLIEGYQNPGSISLDSTMAFDAQLQELKKQLPSIEDLHPGSDGTSSFGDVYDGSIALIYFNYIRTLLHLPFVVKFNDSTFEYSRKVSLDSAREMVSAYRMLRQSAHGEYINCRILDFQIFFVCMFLAINAMAFEPFASSKTATDMATIEQDWNRILDVRNLLESAERGSTGAAIVQDSAIQTLDQLLECRHGCPDDGRESATIEIPYFGTITVKPREEVKHVLCEHSKFCSLMTPSTTLSSCGSPASQPSWQLPTPPISTDSSHLASLDGGKNYAHIAFDRENIPLPSAYNMDALNGVDNGAFAFNNSIYMNDMVGTYDWMSMPVTFDTDMGSGWLAAAGQQQTGTGDGTGAGNGGNLGSLF